MSSTVDSPTAIATAWISDLSQASTVDAFADLFVSNGWMRDHLCFSWDFRSSEGPDIAKYLLEKLDGNKSRFDAAEIFNIALDVSSSLGPPSEDPTITLSGGRTKAIIAYFTFNVRNPDRTCRGCVRLIQEKDVWKALMLFTTAQDLVGHEEPTKRPVGVWEDHTKTWQEVHEEYIRGVENDPTVLIVGGAQNGLMCAARLKRMGIRALVVEKSARVGDVWRNRYPNLSLHLDATFCSILYQSWPETYPKFIPKDMIADSLEAYAKTQYLAIWLSSTILSDSIPVFDETTKRWSVSIQRQNGNVVTLNPKHIIMAVGIGNSNVPTIQGQEYFKGEVHHSDHHSDAHKWAGKRAVIIGTGSSSSDVAMSFLSSEHRAASVTMVQRSPTCVVSGQTTDLLISRGYPENRPLGDSDFVSSSISPGLNIKMAREGGLEPIKQMDKELIEGLEAKGFKTTLELVPGGGEVGTWGFVFERASSGATLDMGVGKYIINGNIEVKSGVDVERFYEDGIILSDGSRLVADVVVFATGNRPMIENITSVFGEAISEKIGNKIWGLDEAGEIKNVYRPTGQPGLWIAIGSFVFARFYSKHLALQILAEELELK